MVLPKAPKPVSPNCQSSIKEGPFSESGVKQVVWLLPGTPQKAEKEGVNVSASPFFSPLVLLYCLRWLGPHSRGPGKCCPCI